MRQFVIALLGSMVLWGCAFGQNVKEHSFLRGGVIQYANGSATVMAKGARPLYQAIAAVREEYGWVVDYEDPPYQNPQDLGTIPWPAHPGAKWMVPASGRFQCSYPEGPKLWDSTIEEEQVLGKIVSDYNKSGNPGRFVVRKQSDGSYAIIGVAARNLQGIVKPVQVILDTPVSVPAGTPRNSLARTKGVLHALSSAAGFKVVAGTVGTNMLLGSMASSRGGSVRFRTVLLQTITQDNAKMVWDLLYDPQFRQFVLSISTAVRAEYDQFGNRKLIPLSVPMPPPSE